MLEYILCYGGPAEHWGPLLATRLASRKILIQQNIKKRTGPSLCVLCVHDILVANVYNRTCATDSPCFSAGFLSIQRKYIIKEGNRGIRQRMLPSL
jgi:hypothetical protein